MKRMLNKLLGVACGAGLLAGAITSQAATINIAGNTQFAVDQNWTSNNEYVLQGYVYVLSGATLNIEAGTVIRGVDAAAPNFGALFICRGGKINALGTSDRPIIFTSQNDILADPFDIPFTLAGRQLWGGVVILGNGLINRGDAAGTSGLNGDGSKWAIYEGLPDVNGTDGNPLHRFGGINNDDNSGVMRFVSIRHGGKPLNADKEINGLSMAGVGRGTSISCIETYQQGDDAFEWWGGAVNSKYLVAFSQDDECFDMDMGHIGKHQFLFGVQAIQSDEGMELNGQPSGTPNVNVVGAQPFGRFQMLNVTLLGNKTDTGNDAMNTRSEFYGEIRNSVFENFSGADQVSSVANYYGTVHFNHWFNNSGNGIAVAGNGNVRTSDAVDPLIANEDVTQSQLLDPRPTVASPLLVAANTYPTPVDGFFSPAPYKGAFTATENWLLGWTAVSQNRHTVDRGAAVVNVAGNTQYAVDTTWTAGNTYVLQGYVYVLSGATLTIEPGTIIRGVDAAAPNFGALFICRGGKINAVGTPCAPIVFTSEFDDLADPLDIPFTLAGRQLWGGVVILGNGLINRGDAAGTSGLNGDGSKWAIYEGLPDVNGTDGLPLHRFGGNNNDESSGVMRFVSIRHGGKPLNADKEINGLSMAGVGRGTTIEWIETYQQGDDAFEWWGGAVNGKYLVAFSQDDECFDMDMGYHGLNQFLFGVQAIQSDEGMELNGQPSGTPNVNVLGAQPFGRFQMYNVTLLGNKTDTGNDLMNTRSEFYGEIRNSLGMDFSGADQVSSVPNYYGTVEYNHFFNNSGNGIATAKNTRTGDAINPLLVSTTRTQTRQLDPRPQAASPLLVGYKQVPVNGHFEQAAHKGAFDTQDLWITGWTALDNNAHVTTINAASKQQGPMPRVFPTVSTVGDNATLTWTALPGMTYQVQVSTDASIEATTSWSNLGAAQRNVGESPVNQTYTDVNAIAGVGTKKYYRLITSL